MVWVHFWAFPVEKCTHTLAVPNLMYVGDLEITNRQASASFGLSTNPLPTSIRFHARVFHRARSHLRRCVEVRAVANISTTAVAVLIVPETRVWPRGAR